MNKWLLGLVGAFLLTRGARLTQAVLNLKATVVGAKVWGFKGLTEVEVRVRVRFTNLTRTAVAFQGVALNVFYGGRQIGTAVKNDTVTIAGAGTTDMELPFYVSLLSVGQSLFAALTTKGAPLGAIRFTGVVYVPGADVPVDQTVTLTGLGK